MVRVACISSVSVEPLTNREISMSIRAAIVYNLKCVKCGAVEEEMVRVGAFAMCQKDWEEEFATNSIIPESKLGKKYYKWLDIHTNSLGGSDDNGQ